MNFFCHLHKNSLLMCRILIKDFLQYRSAFWNTPDGGITTLVYLVCSLFGDIVWKLFPSFTDLKIRSWKLIMASVSVVMVCRDSSTKLHPCACRRGCYGPSWPYMVLANTTHVACWWYSLLHDLEGNVLSGGDPFP